MSLLLPCPNCGLRDVSEFRYGGQVIPLTGVSSSDALVPFVSNLPGPQRERWYHRLGCRRWLVVDRDVRTNTVLSAGWLDGAKQ
jgi:sarcosine oxidase subunit delta